MIWTSVPFWPFYFVGVLLSAIALCAWLGRHGPPSTEQTARETTDALKALTLTTPTNRHTPNKETQWHHAQDATGKPSES